MLKLIHAPDTRSYRILVLIDEMQIWDRIEIETVEVLRHDGSGRRDPANPHPEGKVPVLVHDGTVITESAAIMLYLTALFPEAGLAPKPGDPRRGEYLTWLFWYQGVMEPVLMLAAMGVSHPGLTANFRGREELAARVGAALDRGPWLCGEAYSAADLIVSSAWKFFSQFAPEEAPIREWLERCHGRPSLAHAAEYDAKLKAA